jgi:hypothetical protein
VDTYECARLKSGNAHLLAFVRGQITERDLFAL